MGNEWGSSVLKNCHLQEKVELPVGSTRKSLPWALYRAVSTDAGSAGCSLSAFVYSLNAESVSISDGRRVSRADVLQAAENSAKVVQSKITPFSQMPINGNRNFRSHVLSLLGAKVP